MKRQVIILTLTGILCLMGKYAFAQINEGGTPVSFSLDMDAGRESIPEVVMPRVDARALLQEDENARMKDTQKPFRFGYIFEVDIDVKKVGIKKELPNGDKLWLLKIHCPEAYSINLIYDRFKLSKGSKFFIYNEDRTMVLGAFTPEISNNPYDEFATELVQGNTIVLEYYEPKNSNDGVIHISKVVHGYVNTFSDGRGLGDSAYCNVDVICAGNNWEKERRSVCMIILVNTMGTGVLLNNTQQDLKAYILTARHLYFNGNGNRQTENPATSIFRFLHWRPNCGSGTPNTFLSFTGATLRAHHATTDFALLEFGTPPFSWNLYYAGWDRTSNAAQTSTGIHHPRGDAMKISQENDSVVAGVINNVQVWRAYFDQGTVQLGSSGSPLFNQNKRIVGQLSTVPNCSDDNCACTNTNGNYGRFDLAWTGGGTDDTGLSNWLAPDLANPPQTLDGMEVPSISGPTQLCSGSSSTCSVTNAPVGFFWTASSNININGSNTGTSISVSATGSGGGSVSVKLGSATLATYCINTGAPVFCEVDGPTSVDPDGTPHTYYANYSGYGGVPTNYSWSVSGAPSSSWYNISASGGTAYISFYGEATYQIWVTMSNSCGSDYGYVNVEAYNRRSQSPAYTVYPNPVDDILSIDIQQTLSNANKPLQYDIHLYDLQGNLVRQTTANQVGVVQINVLNLPDDNYFLHIYDGTGAKPYMKQIVVRH